MDETIRTAKARSSGRRDRTTETSAFVGAAIERWLVWNESPIVRIHPQELLAGRTPIGVRVRIRIQAARTSVASSVARLLLRESRDPMLVGYTPALALPDTPSNRRSCGDAVAALPPGRTIIWLFVDREGAIEVVPPPHENREAAEPESADQSSTRSVATA